MLRFRDADNFRFPYAAIGFSDFRRRWHITLSSWLRDYVYIPFGGNRHGPGRTYLALMSTMLLGGFWHGANWTFVAWGGLHGTCLFGERVLRRRFAGYSAGPWELFGIGMLTNFLTNITWVVFIVVTLVVVAGIVTAHWLMRKRTFESVIARTPHTALAVVWACLLFAIVISQSQLSDGCPGFGRSSKRHCVNF